jgi:hypothetical protein
LISLGRCGNERLQVAPEGEYLDASDERLLSPLEAARRLRMQPATLKAWRLRKQGPNYIFISARCVRYRECDLDSWIRQHRVEHDATGLSPAARGAP